MDNRKETERAELHRIIWNIANDLRGSVDGWDFKQYVLGMLFYRYISENLAAYIDKGEWKRFFKRSIAPSRGKRHDRSIGYPHLQ